MILDTLYRDLLVSFQILEYHKGILYQLGFFFFFFQGCNSMLRSSQYEDKARKHFDLLSLLCLLLFSDMLYMVEAFQQISLEGQFLKTYAII